LKESTDAWILNIGSLAGRNTFAGGVAYNASKFGLLGMTEAMMLDLRYEGIRVSHIMPGSVDTSFGGRSAGEKEGWALTSEDVSRAVLDLLRYPGNALPSRVELRPSRPPRKA
jgi:short-subunit dehydrogenase